MVKILSKTYTNRSALSKEQINNIYEDVAMALDHFSNDVGIDADSDDVAGYLERQYSDDQYEEYNFEDPIEHAKWFDIVNEAVYNMTRNKEYYK